MKSLSSIKEKVARDNDYEDFAYVRNNLSLAQIVAILDQVAIEYAEEACKDLAEGILTDYKSNPN